MIKPGRYRHFKGNEYEVIALGKNSENPDELLVVYKALYGEGDIWVRPLSMWRETVRVGDKTVPRFELIEE